MHPLIESSRRFYRWLKTMPDRSSRLYPRLLTLGGQNTNKNRTLIKPTASNLRYFSRTPCARRAINTIKNPIKHMQWEIVPKKGITLNSELKRQIAVTTACFEKPNGDDSFGTFVEKLIEDYLTVSAGCYEQQYDIKNEGHPLWMWNVDGQSIETYPLWDGNPKSSRYKQTLGSGNVSLTAVAELADEELVYIAPNPSASTPYGYGPLEICARSINRQLGAGEFAGNVASNSQPANMLWLGDIDGAALQTFRSYWRDEVEGMGSTPLVGGPDEPKAIRLTGDKDDGLYLKWQQFLIAEIATGFDLSVENFNIADIKISTDSNSAANERDWETAVKPMALTLQDFFNRQTIFKRLGFTQIEFQFIGLDREEEEAQADIHEKQYQNNIITPNEARAQLGMLPSTNPFADMLYADVQIAIGEARRGGVNENAPDKLHNLPPNKLRSLK